jgi:hypothetical protein
VVVVVIPALVDIESSAGGGGERGFGTRHFISSSVLLLANRRVRGREYEEDAS